MVNNTIKAKAEYAKEVAAIKNKELFGIDSCGASWENLFRKHLAFDVLKCGATSCDNKNCLDNEIGKNCNC